MRLTIILTFLALLVSQVCCVAEPVNTVGQAKLHQDGETVTIDSAVVTGPGALYIQEDDYSSGIHVSINQNPFDTGDVIRLTGVMQTSSLGVRTIKPSITTKIGTRAVRPLLVTTSDIAGESWNCAPGSSAGQIGVKSQSGLSLVGMLVTVSGVVREVNSQGWFGLYDGDHYADGKIVSYPPEGKGVCISRPFIVLPKVGDVVSVTGHCSIMSYAWTYGIVYPRSQSDVQIIQSAP
ncbi:MAG: hypothetical protein WCL39_15765 [Armatimonadota bacterium]